jgi:hypothetical protein
LFQSLPNDAVSRLQDWHGLERQLRRDGRDGDSRKDPRNRLSRFCGKDLNRNEKGRRALPERPVSHFSASSGLKYNLCGIDGFFEVFLSFISGHLVRPWGRADQRPDAGHQTPSTAWPSFTNLEGTAFLFSHEHQRGYSRLICLFSRRFLTLSRCLRGR